MSTDLSLFGTNQKPVESKHLRVNMWSMSYENGALRHICLDKIEAIRGIAFLVRDRDWGTLVPSIKNEKIVQDDDTLHLYYDATFESNGASLSVAIKIEANGERLTMSAMGHATGAFETNRAGFTVLHPIDGVAGTSVKVEHSDGSSETSQFPALIEPWQPFMDITALSHQVGENAVTCQFHGDTFEMEDQRQWGDASFKTYNRPLAKEWPYEIADAETLEQSVELTWSPSEPKDKAQPETSGTGATFPEMALVLSSEDALRLAQNPEDISYVNPQRLLCTLDASLGNTAAQFDAFAKAQSACPDKSFDLELICLFASDPETELETLASQMKTASFKPSSILVCPSVDRQSTPPGSEWPDCPPLETIHAAAQKCFENITCGGGMVSFFPELNRKRPPVDKLNFVSHGLCPIVHAADDLSVMETLHTISHITRSARAIIGDKDYRIGPATIAMRQNPYGERTIPNPNNERVCMAHDDPRHRAKFGAAYVIGLATVLAPAGISIWAPAYLYGPRGVIAQTGSWPIAEALKELAKAAGKPVHKAQHSADQARLWLGDTEFFVNLTAKDLSTLDPFQWRAAPR